MPVNEVTDLGWQNYQDRMSDLLCLLRNVERAPYGPYGVILCSGCAHEETPQVKHSKILQHLIFL